MSRRTLLGVWAHPDDEAYTSAGLMATFRRRGDRVVVITATLGEHGTSDPETWPPRRLAELRHTELRNSLAALDVDELHLLGYQDGDCERERRHPSHRPPHRRHRPRSHRHLRARRHDRAPRPPGHQPLDHRRLGNHPAPRRPVVRHRHRRLPPNMGPRQQPDRVVGRSARTRPAPPQPTWPLSTRLPDTLLDLKVAALEAHASQTRPLIELLGPTTYREWWRTESFRRPHPGAREIATTPSPARDHHRSGRRQTATTRGGTMTAPYIKNGMATLDRTPKPP